MSTAILAHGAGAEHADGMLLGLPTYMYGVIATVVFAVLLLITLSYSGRGIVRPDHAPEAFDDEEAKLLKEYNSRHGQ